MRRAVILLIIVLSMSVISCFLPWLRLDAAIGGEERIIRDIYGFDYVAPLGAPYTAPVAILNVVGFILSAYSFKQTKKIKMLNAAAGILILIGIVASFSYTTTVGSADATNRGGTIDFGVQYGMGLEALFGLLVIAVGARCARPPKKKLPPEQLELLKRMINE
ncbi:MAG: hypothetical protein JSV85_01305 [Candidatus Bathyarchaeota archaeon]|nr:MAG: hypothetical protein JSV85_01305 [Candidatus Bathyarchaeota archaeon]